MKKAVAWGLLGAWMVHDAEELMTMAGWARKNRDKLPAWLADRLDVSQAHVNVSIGLMGGVMAAASAAGAKTGGRSGFFRAALAGFGLHGVMHLAQAAAMRGYTPGVVTAPIVVIPFSVWAWRQLDDTDATTSSLWGLALLPAALVGVHGIARVATRRRERWF